MQVLDTSTKSLEELGFASSTRKSFQPRHRQIAEMFATICWFHELRIHLDSSTTVEVQRAVESTIADNALGTARRWRDYGKGFHSPRGRVIEMSRKICPDAVDVFLSPLWDTLRLNRPIEPVAQAHVGTTSKLGDELLTRMATLDGKAHLDPRWLRKRCLDMVRLGTLEGLGVLLICMRLAGARGENGLTVTFYRYAGHCMNILGGWFFAHGIASSLGEYFETIMLPACSGTPWLGNFMAEYYISRILCIGELLQKATALRDAS